MYVRVHYFKGMLTKTEKRFVRHWEEQRMGGRMAYVAQNTLAGTIMLSLFSFVVLFFGMHVLFSWKLLIIVTSIAITVSCIVSYLVWQKNERKFRDLIKREVDAGVKANDL
jgi:hypothetical protein